MVVTPPSASPASPPESGRPGSRKVPLQQTASTTATDYRKDSCSIEEPTYAIARGAVGATTNPTIVGDVLKKEMHLWRERIAQLVADNPTWSEDAVTWRLIEEMALRGAELWLPVFEREEGKKGRLSNATVSFTVPQALAVAAAVERGLQRREAAGEDVAAMTPVCTLMVGRLDDWLQVLVQRDGVVATPGIEHWASLACMKKAYGIVRERGYRTRLLAAAYRHHLHWSELIGGDVVLTIPYGWQLLFNHRFPDFRRAYDIDGMDPEEFDSYGATARTLRGFIASYHDLVAVIRDFVLPDPDVT